jgi:hypothetical protein
VNTSATFRFYPLGNLPLSLGDAHLTPGYGAHKMTIPMDVAGTWLTGDDPRAASSALIMGTVTTEQPSYRWLAGTESQVVALRGYPVREELVLDLADEQLIALERARGRGDVVLRLDIRVTLLAVQGVHPVAQEQLTYRISAGRWLELLDQVGSEVGVLIRVPSPLTETSLEPAPAATGKDLASLAQATLRLRQARAELRDGQWEHSVATCRRVLENLALLMEMPKAGPLFATKPDDRTQAERRAAIYHDVKSLASAAHHDDETTLGFSWGRADAEAVLAMTAGLLLWLDASSGRS